jgi:hypothetical protein
MIFGSFYRPMSLVMMKYLISRKKLYYSSSTTVKWFRMIFGSFYGPMRLVMMKYLISLKKLYYSIA